MLQTLGTGAAALAIDAAFHGARAAGVDMPTAAASDDEKRRIPLRARPFDLVDVRLLDGPFRQAQERDAKYLLQLEPDRLLHNFRVNAGLQPKAEVYGGWESVRTWADIRAHGHTLGHYLSACSLMYASTAGDEFKDRCDYIVGQLQECQSADKTGLVCAFPDKAEQIENLVAGRRAVGTEPTTRGVPHRGSTTGGQLGHECFHQYRRHPDQQRRQRGQRRRIPGPVVSPHRHETTALNLQFSYNMWISSLKAIEMVLSQLVGKVIVML
jgi:hypothetical protein